MDFMQKQCKQCSAQYEITQNDLNFYDKLSPVFNWKKYNIPSPTQCPSCREQRRLAFRNESNLYKRKCNATWKNIISNYSSDKDFVVYHKKEWWSDKWNPLDYWVEFDFTKPFFDQYQELLKKVPRYNLYNFDTENCEYVQYMPHSKNCYLVFGWWYNEDCYYWNTFIKSKNCVDWYFVSEWNMCYENIDTDNCYKCFYAQNSKNCSDSLFIYDCIWSKYCIWCVNLRNKEYHILNEKVTKKEFEDFKNDILSSYDKLQKFKNEFDKFKITNAKHKYYYWDNNENITWDYIYNSKNLKNCFISYENKNCMYSTRFASCDGSYDINWTWHWELILDCSTCDYWYNLKFSLDSEHCKDSFYILTLTKFPTFPHKQVIIQKSVVSVI